MSRQSQNFNWEYNNATDILYGSTDPNFRSAFEHASLQENNGWGFNFNLGARIGIRL